jgi:hypothetical protein
MKHSGPFTIRPAPPSCSSVKTIAHSDPLCIPHCSTHSPHAHSHLSQSGSAPCFLRPLAKHSLNTYHKPNPRERHSFSLGSAPKQLAVWGEEKTSNDAVVVGMGTGTQALWWQLSQQSQSRREDPPKMGCCLSSSRDCSQGSRCTVVRDRGGCLGDTMRMEKRR